MSLPNRAFATPGSPQGPSIAVETKAERRAEERSGEEVGEEVREGEKRRLHGIGVGTHTHTQHRKSDYAHKGGRGERNRHLSTCRISWK